jgi:hypothetical protein
MTFNAMQLPKSVQDVFYGKNLDWSVLYWAARRSGISDENKLADLLFYHAHKEWVFPGGSVPLKPGMANYNALVAEWKRFKQLARSLSHGNPGDETTGSPSKTEESKSKTAEFNLKFAKSAVTYTRSVLSFGAGNQWEDVKGSGGLSIVGMAHSFWTSATAGPSARSAKLRPTQGRRDRAIAASMLRSHLSICMT